MSCFYSFGFGMKRDDSNEGKKRERESKQMFSVHIANRNQTKRNETNTLD